MQAIKPKDKNQAVESSENEEMMENVGDDGSGKTTHAPISKRRKSKTYQKEPAELEVEDPEEVDTPAPAAYKEPQEKKKEKEQLEKQSSSDVVDLTLDSDNEEEEVPPPRHPRTCKVTNNIPINKRRRSTTYEKRPDKILANGITQTMIETNRNGKMAEQNRRTLEGGKSMEMGNATPAEFWVGEIGADVHTKNLEDTVSSDGLFCEGDDWRCSSTFRKTTTIYIHDRSDSEEEDR